MSTKQPIREHLSFQNYDKNFNFNSDRFCCSSRGFKHRQAVYSQYPPIVVSKDYSVNRNYTDKDLATPLWAKQVFGDSGNTYTFNVQQRSYVECGRQPSGFTFNEAPCASKRVATVNPGCCDRTVNSYEFSYNYN
jgi:hypothetical protein